MLCCCARYTKDAYGTTTDRTVNERIARQQLRPKLLWMLVDMVRQQYLPESRSGLIPLTLLSALAKTHVLYGRIHRRIDHAGYVSRTPSSLVFFSFLQKLMEAK